MMSHRLPQILPHLGNTIARRAFATGSQRSLRLPRLSIFEALDSHPKSKVAIVHSESGKSFTYGDLLADTARYRSRLMMLHKPEFRMDLGERRIAFLVENGYHYVVSMLSIFASGGIAVPLCTSHPTPEMRYVISNSTPTALITSTRYLKKSEEILDTPELKGTCKLDIINNHVFPGAGTRPSKVELVESDAAWMNRTTTRGALIIYTSGTTNLPKGVVSTHSSLMAQSNSLMKVWEMNEADYLLHILPLHHVHGIVNATLAPLIAGGTVEYLFPFNAESVWNRLAAKEKKAVTLFMGVPTVYNRLLSIFPTLPEEIQAAGQEAVRSLRLAISGSAALPGSIKDQWRALAGTDEGGGTMLERYGMTEIGMALSQRLPLSDRMANSVGWPLPGVEVRLADIETGETIPAEETEKEGEIQIRGPTVFREYWEKPDATRKEFTDKGWFKTGDVAVRDERGAYYIHGRASVDIIKSGGEKVSALEVERELLELPQISEAAVVALPDREWGQRVAAIVVLSERGKKESFGYEEMRKAMKEKLASYKVPTVMRIAKALKRNQMGKINKKVLVKEEFKNRGGV